LLASGLAGSSNGGASCCKFSVASLASFLSVISVISLSSVPLDPGASGSAESASAGGVDDAGLFGWTSGGSICSGIRRSGIRRAA
jgi:hypothetical protein